MSSSYKSVNRLKISEDLLLFVNKELLKDTGIIPEKFWSGFDEAVHYLVPKNKDLLVYLVQPLILLYHFQS